MTRGRRFATARMMPAPAPERGGSRTPILALSANVMSYQIEEYLAAGMNGFIAKPIEMAALISAMERALAPDDAEAKSAAA